MDRAGVDITKCKYIFNTINTGIGTDPSSYTGGGFTKEREDKITIPCTASGTYYLHVLTFDKAGNKKETISEKVEIESYIYDIVQDGKLVAKNAPISYGTSTNVSDYSVGPYARVSLRSIRGESTGVAYWEIPVRASNARVEAVYEGWSVNSACTPVRLFGSPIKHTDKYEAGRTIDGAYNDIILNCLEQSREKGNHSSATLDLTGLKNLLYVGFSIDGRADWYDSKTTISLKMLRIVF